MPARAWDRLPAESTAAYDAFCRYVELGPDRTFSRAQAATGKTALLLRRWSHDHNWPGRAADYDARVPGSAAANLPKPVRGAPRKQHTWEDRKRVSAERAYQRAQRLLKKCDALLEMPVVSEESTTLDGGKTVIKVAAIDTVELKRVAELIRVAQEMIDDAISASCPDERPVPIEFHAHAHAHAHDAGALAEFRAEAVAELQAWHSDPRFRLVSGPPAEEPVGAEPDRSGREAATG